jgi:hypothetical protein
MKSETELDALLIRALKLLPTRRRKAIIREATAKESKRAGRPQVDERAYRILNIAWKRWLEADSKRSGNRDKAAQDFYKRKHALFEKLGLRIAKGRARAAETKWPDYDSLRHALKRGTQSKWVALVRYDGSTWRPVFRLREDYETDQYVKAALLFALTEGKAGAPGLGQALLK